MISTARGDRFIRRSSTPIIAVYRHLHLLQKAFEKNTRDVERMEDLLNEMEVEQTVPEQVQDVGFSVLSNPKFLYHVGKICLKAELFNDLAIQCLYDYLTVCGFYKEFIGKEKFEIIRRKIVVMLAQALVAEGHSAEAEKMINSVKKDIYAAAKNGKINSSVKATQRACQFVEQKLKRR